MAHGLKTKSQISKHHVTQWTPYRLMLQAKLGSTFVTKPKLTTGSFQSVHDRNNSMRKTSFCYCSNSFKVQSNISQSLCIDLFKLWPKCAEVSTPKKKYSPHRVFCYCPGSFTIQNDSFQSLRTDFDQTVLKWGYRDKIQST